MKKNRHRYGRAHAIAPVLHASVLQGYGQGLWIGNKLGASLQTVRNSLHTQEPSDCENAKVTFIEQDPRKTKCLCPGSEAPQ